MLSTSQTTVAGRKREKKCVTEIVLSISKRPGLRNSRNVGKESQLRQALPELYSVKLMMRTQRRSTTVNPTKVKLKRCELCV